MNTDTSSSPSSTSKRLPQVDDKVHCRYLGRDGKFVKAGHMMFTIEWERGGAEELQLDQVAHLDYSHGRWVV